MMPSGSGRFREQLPADNVHAALMVTEPLPVALQVTTPEWFRTLTAAIHESDEATLIDGAEQFTCIAHATADVLIVVCLQVAANR